MTARGTGALAASRLLASTGAFVLSLFLAMPPALAAPTAGTAVSPTGASTLRGVLLLGQPSAPVGGQKVTLHGVATGAEALTLSVTTDAKGRFVFDKLAGGDAWTYTVTTVHKTTTFTTDALTVKAGETLTTTLQTYDVTTSPAAITWPSWVVWVDPLASGIAVQQDVTMRNAGTTAYTGTEPVPGAPDGGKAAVVLPVTSGATNVSYLDAFLVCCDAIVGSTWLHSRPVPPGTTAGILRYETPTPSSLTFPVTVQTEKFELLLPQGLEAASAELSAAGTRTDAGTTYQVLRGGPLAAGTTITVTLGSTGSSPWGWIALGALVVVLVGGAVWFWRRPRAATTAPAPARAPKGARPTPAKPAAAKPSAKKPAGQASRAGSGKPPVVTPPKTAKPGAGVQPVAAPQAAPPTPAAPAPAAPVSRDDASVLADELAMLDLAHENGALPDEESYQRVRESLVSRLVAALGQDPDALDDRAKGH